MGCSKTAIMKSRVLLLLAVFVGVVSGDNIVNIESTFGAITSSTLKWVSSYRNFDDAVAGGVQTKDDTTQNIYICRTSHLGLMLAGFLDENERTCVVSMHGTVYRNKNHEVLFNIEDSAKLNWFKWDKYTPTPLGLVIVEPSEQDRNYIGRYNYTDESGEVHTYIGTMDPHQKLGKIIAVGFDGKVIEPESGEILMETEPKRYEIIDIKFTMKQSRFQREPKILAEKTLVNYETSPMKVDAALSYNYTHLMYWGRGQGILIGLNTSLQLSNGTELRTILWGERITEEREEVITVETPGFLEPNTAINVTLKGDYTEVDLMYTATLIAHYPNSTTKQRKIRDTRNQKTMLDVKAEFGPAYFVNNNTLVPTTTTTTTTTTTSTTTTTTSTTEEPKPIPETPLETSSTNKPKKTFEDNNVIDKKGENQSMLGDEALSLKKKTESELQAEMKQASPSGSSVLFTNVIVLMACILTQKICC